MEETKRGWLEARCIGVVTLFGVLACIGTVAGLAGGAWWGFDLASHFRVQYLLGLALAVIVLLVVRRPKTALVFTAFALVNLILVAPFYVGASDDGVADGDSCRVLLCNVQTRNTRFEAVEAYVRATQPDIVVLLEVNADWIAALESLQDLLPYSTSDPRSDNFGIAVYSRVPPRAAVVERIGPASVRSIVAEFGTDDDWFTMIATHPVPPQGRVGSEVRNAQLAELGRLVTTIESPVMLVGDLNATPWSHPFRRLIDRTGLASASLGQGVRPTWPAVFPAPMRIPIDHCLCSAEFDVVRTRVGPDVGSDHLPLLIDLRLPCALAPRVAGDVDAEP